MASATHYGDTKLHEKRTIRYQEQDLQKVATYLEQINEKIAYVDECKIDTYLYRDYGYAHRGHRVFGLICGKKHKKLGIVAAKIANKFLEPLQYSETMNSKFFGFWFSNQLLRLSKKGR